MEYALWRKRLMEEISKPSMVDFEEIALSVFRFQAYHNSIYRQFLTLLGAQVDKIRELSAIPFLPITTFKNHSVKTGTWEAQCVFQSSGAIKSQHHIRSLEHYHQHAIETFEDLVLSLNQSEIFGLLPHYLRAGQSSLVSMVKAFMNHSGQRNEHFYLDDFDALSEALHRTEKGRKPILFGVTYALLDFAFQKPASIPKDTIVIETGGMKGREEEWDKHRLHLYLKERLDVTDIRSEYGMTELISQAYARAPFHLQSPQTLRVLCKEFNDPFREVRKGKAGVMHLIDLANIDTCSFIASEDIGIDHGPLGFEIVGRLQDSDLRGCQLLYL